MIDENTPHRLGRRLHESASATERAFATELEIGLVDQGSGIERMLAPFMGQLSRGQTAEFIIDLRYQFLRVHLLEGVIAILAFSACHFFTSSGWLVSV